MKLHWYRNGIEEILYLSSKNINMAINVFKYQFCVKRKFRKWLLFCTFVYILSHHLIQIANYYMPSDTTASYIAQERIPWTAHGHSFWAVNIRIKTDNSKLFKKTKSFSGKVESLGNLTEIRKLLGTKIYNGNKFPEQKNTIIVGKPLPVITLKP